jgi:hypothetical protein
MFLIVDIKKKTSVIYILYFSFFLHLNSQTTTLWLIFESHVDAIFPYNIFICTVKPVLKGTSI